MKRVLFSLFIVLLAFASCKKDINQATVKDKDGNIYHTVKIGNQTWMVENLKTTKYRDGSNISNITDATQWGNSVLGAYCNFGNDEETAKTYGRLYNWYAVNDPRGLAPEGWHIASDAEWATLIQELGGDIVAGSKLKEAGTIHWDNTSAEVNNSSGFTAFGAGFRGLNNSNVITYQFFGLATGYWTSTEDTQELAWLKYLGAFESNVYSQNKPKFYGYSVRCVKD